VAIAGVERVAKLAVMPANPGQAALQRGDACGLRAVSGADVSSAGMDSADVSSAGGDSAVGAGGEIEPDRLRIWRQLRQALPAQPGGEVPPVGVVGALGVVGPGGAGVVLGGFGERGEAIVSWGAGRGQGVFVGRRSCIVLVFPTALSDSRNLWDSRSLESNDFPVAQFQD